MSEVLARCARMSQLKGYLRTDIPIGRVVPKPCARELIGLNQGPRGLDLLRRQGREEPQWEAEVVPEPKEPEEDELPSDGSVEVGGRNAAMEEMPRISIPKFKGQTNNFSGSPTAVHSPSGTSPPPQPHYSPHSGALSSPGYAPAAYLFNPAMYPMVVTPRLNSLPGQLSPPMSTQMIFPSPSSNRSMNSMDGKQRIPDVPDIASWQKDNSGRFQEAFTEHARANSRGQSFSQTQVSDVVPVEPGVNDRNDQTPRGQFLGKFSFARNSIPQNGPQPGRSS